VPSRPPSLPPHPRRPTTGVRRLDHLAFLPTHVDPPGALLIHRVASVLGYLTLTTRTTAYGQSRSSSLHTRLLPDALTAASHCRCSSVRPASARAHSARRALSATQPSHARSVAAPIERAFPRAFHLHRPASYPSVSHATTVLVPLPADRHRRFSPPSLLPLKHVHRRDPIPVKLPDLPLADACLCSGEDLAPSPVRSASPSPCRFAVNWSISGCSVSAPFFREPLSEDLVTNEPLYHHHWPRQRRRSVPEPCSAPSATCALESRVAMPRGPASLAHGPCNAGHRPLPGRPRAPASWVA
jgi:hypothetical protein